LQLSDFTGAASPSGNKGSAILLREGEGADIDFPKKEVTVDNVKNITWDK